ncbi:hypothetical protein T492DRAFT_832385 [Pavlovales sp. CCMP2436]|nr:hypothetical protein T492DRAFT_832385 [Pavlovales sp. CCMP2436]
MTMGAGSREKPAQQSRPEDNPSSDARVLPSTQHKRTSLRGVDRERARRVVRVDEAGDRPFDDHLVSPPTTTSPVITHVVLGTPSMTAHGSVGQRAGMFISIGCSGGVGALRGEDAAPRPGDASPRLESASPLGATIGVTSSSSSIAQSIWLRGLFKTIKVVAASVRGRAWSDVRGPQGISAAFYFKDAAIR